jgi:hypothetical protein
VAVLKEIRSVAKITQIWHTEVTPLERNDRLSASDQNGRALDTQGAQGFVVIDDEDGRLLDASD